MLVALVLLSTRGGPSPFALAAAGAAAGAQEPDTDGDTMPDAWETFFGLDPNDAGDATGNPDSDGRTNAQEFADGRHPNGRHMRYFAEGSTGYFDTSVGVLNLSETQTAHVAIALLNEVGGVVSHRFTLAPRARQTVSINAGARDLGRRGNRRRIRRPRGRGSLDDVGPERHRGLARQRRTRAGDDVVLRRRRHRPLPPVLPVPEPRRCRRPR